MSIEKNKKGYWPGWCKQKHSFTLSPPFMLWVKPQDIVFITTGVQHIRCNTPQRPISIPLDHKNKVSSRCY